MKDAAARNDIRSTQVVSGNPLTLTDAAPINAEKLEVELEPKQDLHGQDAPYVGGAGKNKLPMTVDGIKAANTDGTWTGNAYALNGVTFTINTDVDGNVTSLKVNGTASATIFFKLCDFPACMTDGSSYKINGNASGYGSSTAYMQVQTSNGGGVANVGSEYTLAYTSGGTAQRLIIRIDTNGNPSNLVFYPMIRLSTETDSTFAPYSNICPITGYTECEVDDVGKNLFGGDAFADKIVTEVTGAVKDTTNKTISYSAGNISGVLLFDGFKPNTRYTFITNQISGVANLAIGYSDGTSTVIRDAHIMTSTAGKTVTGLYGYYSTGNTVLNYEQTGIFEGAINESDFEPYHSSNATIQFGQTVYGGRSNFTDGGTDKTYGYDADLGAAGRPWWAEDDGVFRTELLDSKFFGILYCSMYKGVQKDWPDDGEITVTNSQAYQLLRIKDPTCVGYTAAEFAAHISGCQLAYELAEPTQLSTPPTELKLLKGTNNITTNGTTINLGYQPDNVIGEVKGEIQKITEMPYLRILDNDIDTEVKNYRLYYRLISSSYTLVNLAEMLQHRFLFVEVIQNPSGTANHTLLHSALIDPRTIDGFEYQMKAGTGDTVIIESNIAENKFELSVRYTGTHTSGDPTDYYVTIRLVD